MKNQDVYEQWKQQRGSMKPPSHFVADVMANVDEPDHVTPGWADRLNGLLDRPVWATAAVLAASVLGVLRICVALFIGIRSTL